MNISTIGRCELFLQKAKDVAMSRGFECLSKKYVNNHTKLKFRCMCGCVWNASYNSITNMESGCPRCGRKRMADAMRYCLDDCINTATERLGFCDSIEYVDCKTKMHWRCFLGHRWDACYDSIINCGTWCPYCNIPSIGETITRKFFEIGFKSKFPRCRPMWLVNKKGNRLELDGYNEKLKIAFEFNGRQHKKENNLFHRYRSFDDCISGDRDKIRLCKNHDISLIVVDYDIRFYNIAKYIYGECKKRGLDISKKILDLDYKKFNFFVRDLVIERGIIEEKGGVLCPDQKYVDCETKLDVVCGKGHKFSVSPDKLKTKGRSGTGTWCPVCAGNSKITLGYINEFVKSGGVCLSKKYVNNHSKLKFCCFNGHVFCKTWMCIQMGFWCNECNNI